MSGLKLLGKLVLFIIIAQIAIALLLPNVGAAYANYLNTVWILLLLVGVLSLILGGGKAMTSFFKKICGLLFETVKKLIFKL